MFQVVISRGLVYDTFAEREHAQLVADQLRAAGRTSARVEFVRVTL